METPSIPDLQHLTLPSREDCPTAYTTSCLCADFSCKGSRPIWLIFINGLGLPQAFWQPTLNVLKEAEFCTQASGVTLYTTTYDRYGQGLSRPADGSTPKKHDLTDSVEELHNFLGTIWDKHISELAGLSKAELSVIVIAHSIGVPLARLYLSKYSKDFNFTGLLLLDSNMAHVDMVKLLPDPASSDFDVSQLPDDTDLEKLEWTRANYANMFSPSAPNMENLDRSTLPALLPKANEPNLPQSITLTVVAHDPAQFAEESLRISTNGLTEGYIEPAWHEYNVELQSLDWRTGQGREEIIVAAGAGHFVQKDNPQCVADEIWKLIRKM